MPDWLSIAQRVPGGKTRAHERDVRREDPRAALPLHPFFARRVVAEPGIAAKRERVRAEQPAGEIVLHVLAHPLDDRHDGDEEHHADHDAEEREEALELLNADLDQRETDGFEEAASRYSYRSASTGSSRDARIAGSMPNITPVTALAPSAATIASGGIDAWIGVAFRMITDTMPPPIRPNTAPIAGERHRLDQELPENRAARRAERLAHADLARALGDRDHHDRDDAHAADEQADRRQHDHHEEEHARRSCCTSRTACPA